MDLKLYLQLLISIPCIIAMVIGAIGYTYLFINWIKKQVRRFKKFVRHIERRYVYLTELEKADGNH